MDAAPAATPLATKPTRELILHRLYEAAELEHNLMCTYLYAAFSLRVGDSEGLTAEEAEAVARWRTEIIRVAVDEMGHLTAVWNITSALGGVPRFGRGNFPLDPGTLPAGVVVKLVPFGEAALQHFIHLERPTDSPERDGDGFSQPFMYTRGVDKPRLTPMALDYDTVGVFYSVLAADLAAFTAEHGEASTFCGDPALQLSPSEVALTGARTVLCAKTALGAFTAIVEQGEGAREDNDHSHYQRFLAIRAELRALKAKRPDFEPAFPAATNPVLRRPLALEGRVWIDHERAALTVDLANTAYALMLRLIAYAYGLARPAPEKGLVVDLGLGLMRAMTHLGEHAVRLPASDSCPGVNAGMSFSALRDSAAFPPGAAARRFFVERLSELCEATRALAVTGEPRLVSALAILENLQARAARGFTRADADAQAVEASPVPKAAPATPSAATPPTPEARGDGVEAIPGKHLTLLFEAKKCIHSRFCVTGAPKVFLANVEGPWIHPDAMDVESLVEIAHVCPSGAIRYERKDGRPDEQAPPVNLLSIREAGPYALRGQLELDGAPIGFRATLCRCGASKHKPYCDGSHHEVAFSATGEPATSGADMLPVRDGLLAIDPQIDGPLAVRGNLEITSGTGRVVSRLTSARLCRCGGSANKPYCDGTHARIGFRSGA